LSRTDTTAVLEEVQEVYREVRGGTRSLHPEDLLEDELEIDSLLAMEMLVALENRHGVELVGDPRTMQLRTVADLIDLLVAVREQPNPDVVAR
jgi:acyl carrier protein